MLDHLAPARRRLFLGLAGLVALAVVVGAVAAVLSRDEPVDPVAQERIGPVLLVPGYGGSTAALEVLAERLDAEGRDVELVRPPGDGRGDLREHAELLDTAARAAMAGGAPSVDVVGYSAGGVVARVWVAQQGGDALARRVVTLASPHHGTDLAELAGGLAPEACPEACVQLAPDSDLLAELNREDETPDGPLWVSIWTTDDQTVVPPDSGSLAGAVDFSVQSVCPGLTVAHRDVPRTPAVIEMVLASLGADEPDVPGDEVCAPPGQAHPIAHPAAPSRGNLSR
ncbi:MAG: hypothetical protein WKF79_13825 [Nocardioides sp.]